MKTDTTAFLTAPVKEPGGAQILFLIGTTKTGISEKISVYQILAAKDVSKGTLLDRLGDLIDRLKTTP